MSIPGTVRNEGNLFDNEGLKHLEEANWIDEATRRSQFEQIREHYDRRRGTLAENGSPDHVGYYFLGRALHVLGYTHSQSEPLPNEFGTVSYTLFESPEDFQNQLEGRGTSRFFAGAIGTIKVVAWDSDLDSGAEDSGPEHPAFELDDILRHTGLQWAILSNGKKWRLYHRNTAAMLNTFCEVNLGEIIETNDFESFKYFTGVFSKESIASDAMRQILN